MVLVSYGVSSGGGTIPFGSDTASVIDGVLTISYSRCAGCYSSQLSTPIVSTLSPTPEFQCVCRDVTSDVPPLLHMIFIEADRNFHHMYLSSVPPSRSSLEVLLSPSVSHDWCCCHNQNNAKSCPPFHIYGIPQGEVDGVTAKKKVEMIYKKWFCVQRRCFQQDVCFSFLSVANISNISNFPSIKENDSFFIDGSHSCLLICIGVRNF